MSQNNEYVSKIMKHIELYMPLNECIIAETEETMIITFWSETF